MATTYPKLKALGIFLLVAYIILAAILASMPNKQPIIDYLMAPTGLNVFWAMTALVGAGAYAGYLVGRSDS